MRPEIMIIEKRIDDPMIKIDGDTIVLPLSKGKRQKCMYALIDRDDYERVVRHKWYASPSGKTYYARATSLVGLVKHQRQLHMFIVRALPGQRVDHINGDGLDCRKANLRFATQQQNSMNKFKTGSPHVTSKFKGVSRSPSSGKWIAQIKKDGVPYPIGVFETQEAAADAYDAMAVKLFGSFAKTNADMGLFEADQVNRNTNHTGHGHQCADVSEFDSAPQWQRYVETGERYLQPVNIAELSGEAAIRQAVRSIKNPTARRKAATQMRKALSA